MSATLSDLAPDEVRFDRRDHGNRTGVGHARIGQILAAAQREIRRYTPADARAAADAGATLIDIRPREQRVRDGLVPRAWIVQRNVLEWRLDPTSPWRDPRLAVRGSQVILICDEGYQSSLAAATLTLFDLDAGDVVGGVQAWKADGLPLVAPELGGRRGSTRRGVEEWV